ncbi:putative N-acetyltransferase ESCO, zinc-finger, N-acetyltransferase ESCO, acetyl-transferase [Heracleum sosnowskyi]|uniref:N-acetyltransferase ESCO, zinc-finger, N-acetyltransferase ESCO, acetyl-transferase n=1 Tax=Heracleum sosnowskyi TaxID=360622 RepID=A0AAD8ITS6_9APIA|nr:putative N-acetyltransferase ESCO, zinc-finger, N-acetyltransferase ESCO, acetyl-transferase [Heracleum sosnowskyi]
MQSKINSFFKPSSSSSSTPKTQDSDPLFDHILFQDKHFEEHEITVKYKRRTPIIDSENDGTLMGGGLGSSNSGDSSSKLVKPSKVLSKKRNYAQFHLEFGQSDFLLHTCSTCGFKYAAGDQEDEKVHNSFHKTYTHGIQFKGWRNERVIHVAEEGRVLLVLDSDPPAQWKKVQEVVKMMEMELGEGWICNKDCKVYLFISSKRISGCLVAQPIEKAYRIICSAVRGTYGSNSGKKTRSGSDTLQFGSVSFQRERVKSASSSKNSHVLDDSLRGAILCEKEAVPAVCGIRAIWVSPANRRNQIATHLLNATRKSFCSGSILEKSQLAFSQPTSVGKALASAYSGTVSFLVYRTSTSITDME